MTPAATPLHPRNRHQGRYDFAQLVHHSPGLAHFVIRNAHGEQSIDFAEPRAVKALNQALLKAFYHIEHWDIPEGYLCPAIPGRADYIHYLADLLADDNVTDGKVADGKLARTHDAALPRGPHVRVLDVGTGANMIYPIIGHAEYGWQFVGSDIDATALASAHAVIRSNAGLAGAITLRQQKSPRHVFRGLFEPDTYFDLTLCNPPFHASQHDASSGSRRKWRGLGKTTARHGTPTLNFGGQNAELWCEGGEALFISRMIEESAQRHSQVLWFTTLVSKESNLPAVWRHLKKVCATEVRTVDMAQGQKKSRFVAWTFLDPAAQKAWRYR
jgi:23S rRNA (adenine1618-N6)-methyltransferase